MGPNRPSHWILLILVVFAALFTLREVHGQTSTNALSQFEGMPSMAGAQAGLGAQAGPPTGGIGVQGSDAAGLRRGRPSGLDEPRSVMRGEIQRDPEVRPQLAANDQPAVLLPTPPVRRDIGRDTGVARDTGGTTKTASRSVKRAIKRVRHPTV